jgi:hypothetical protein
MKAVSVAIDLLLGAAILATARAQEYVVSTFAVGGPPPTPVLGVDMPIGSLQSVATDVLGNTYFVASHCVFKLDQNGVVTRIAGDGRPGYSGDGGPATSAQLRLQNIDFPPSKSLWAAVLSRPASRWITPGTCMSQTTATIVSEGSLPMESSPPSRATVPLDFLAMVAPQPMHNCPQSSASRWTLPVIC